MAVSILAAASLLAAATLGPGDEQPYYWPRLQHCDRGIVFPKPQQSITVRMIAPAREPVFECVGEIWTHYSSPPAGDDEPWVWHGGFAGEYAVLLLGEGDMVTIEMIAGEKFWTPILDHYTVRRGDWNLDGVVDSADIAAFLTDWLHPRAAGRRVHPGDFNLDGVADSSDITAFLVAWIRGR